MLKKPLIALVFLVLLALWPATAPAEQAHQHHEAPPPATSEVRLEERLGASLPQELEFVDEQGNRSRLGDLLQLPTIIAPIYYGCPNVCSFLQGGLAQALKEVKLTPGKDFQVLSVSFDETETPEHARKAAATYRGIIGPGFPPQAWRFLTGEEKDIRALTEAAGYYFKRQDKDFLHPVAILVVSPEGTIARYLHGTRFLSKDLTLALIEAREGRVGVGIRRLAQFCFSYDPVGRTYVFNLLRVSATVVILTLVGFFLYLHLGKPSNK